MQGSLCPREGERVACMRYSDADDDRVEESVAEQLLRRLALREGSIWKETASLLTETHSQARLERSSPRSSWTRQLVSSAWRSAALFWCARIASASGSSRRTFRLSASVPGETVSPWADIHAATRCTGRKRHSARTGSVPRSWSRRAWGTAAAPGARHFHGRRRALAGGASADGGSRACRP